MRSLLRLQEIETRQLGGLSVSMAGLQRRAVRIADRRVAEAIADPVFGLGRVPIQQPQRQAHGPHVATAQRSLLAEVELLDRIDRVPRDIGRKRANPVQRIRFQRIVVVARLLQGARGERTGIDHEQTVAVQVADVGLERGGIEGHQHVGRVARGEDLALSHPQLKRRHPVRGSGGCPDFRGKIGKRGHSLAAQGGRHGQTHPG